MELAPGLASVAATGAQAPQLEDEISRQSEILQWFYNIPSIDKAWAIASNRGSGVDVVVAMSQMNLPANKKRTYVNCVHVPGPEEQGAHCFWSPFPVELSGPALVAPSPSGEKILVVYNAESGSKDPTRLQIWGSLQLLKEIYVPSKLHGAIFTDGWFEGVSWSHDENQIAYITEEPSPSGPVFGKDGVTNKAEGEPGTWKGQGDWVEDWGECYSGKRRPTIFVADTNSGNVQTVEGIPDDLSAGQVIWAPPSSSNEEKEDGSKLLVFVGWTNFSENFSTPRKLGMKYCYNRPCGLYAAEAPASHSAESHKPPVKLTSGITSAFSPRFSPDGKFLVFLSAKAAVESGAHCATNSLHSIQWSSGGSRSSALHIKDIVPVVMRPDDKGFPGLYCSSLLPHPWLQDNQTLVMCSVWRSIQVIVCVSLESGKVVRLTPSDSIDSWNLLSVHQNLVVAATSSPGGPPELKFTYTPVDWNETVQWSNIVTPVKLPSKVQGILSSITRKILQIPVPASEKHLAAGAKEPFEAILVSSKSPEKNPEPAPLVLVLHGGPHSVSITGFSRTSAFLVSLGYNLLHVNYRGSLGFGEEAIQSLLGNIGRQDVGDVLASLDFVIDKGLANPKKVAVIGGSHGGFLTSHLIGQAPERFVAAVMRNPVCNISSMVGITDIPDWCYMEIYGSSGIEKYTEAPTTEHLQNFHQASPIAHIEKVKAPTLFLLGAQDRRVPVSNGLQYAQALKARGLEVKVIVFPEDIHAIDRPQSDFESFLNVGVWLKRFF